MSRAVSLRAIQAAYPLESPDAFYYLVTLTDPNTGQEYRIARNTQDVTSRGKVFTATWFELALIADTDEAPKGTSIAIDNVDLMLVSLLRTVIKPIGCVLEVVVAATPDVVEIALPYLVLREVNWDASTINGTLVSDDPLNQKFPAHIYEPRTFPGIF